MPGVLLQILLTPLVASAVIFSMKRKLGHLAGWVASLAMLYTTALILLAGTEVYGGKTLHEEYLGVLIAPDIRLGLLADGLSWPTLAVVALLCTALSFYSIRYIEHIIELLYSTASESTRLRYYARFFYLFLFYHKLFLFIITNQFET